MLRLLDQPESGYDAVWILSIPTGEAPTRALAASIGPTASARVVPIDDPSDYAALFAALGPIAAEARRAFPAPGWSIDVLLSAGTPQAQTLWVILVQAGILPARMLQVIPAVFVGPGRSPVRDVRLDIEGFPEIRALRREIARLRERARARSGLLGGESPPLIELRHRGARVAENCGVFAEGLLASELFGHEAGAFTGASSRRKGVFEQAHHGTLLLDEIGELSPRVQAALLRVLQEGALRRVGGEAKVSVDVRIVAATHRDLARMVREGSFREDLYYRLRGATIEVPPLRARPGDVELLIEAFLDEIAARRGGARLAISKDALRAAASYAWPGNVRELRAEVERWGVFCDRVVEERDLADEIRRGPVSVQERGSGREGREVTPLADVIHEAERAAIVHALAVEEGNLSRTARALGIDRNTLKRKMAAFALGR